MGLYSDGSVKHNGVADEHLQHHIEYNKVARFGRALFVNGKCIFTGYFKPDDPLIEYWERILAFEPRTFDKPTVPYH